MDNNEFKLNSDFDGMEVRSITVGVETAKRILNKELVIMSIDGKQLIPLSKDGKLTGEYVFFVGVKTKE